MGANGGVPGVNGNKVKGVTPVSPGGDLTLDANSKNVSAVEQLNNKQLSQAQQRAAAEAYMRKAAESEAAYARLKAQAEGFQQTQKINRQREFFKNWNTATPDTPDAASDLELQKALADRVKQSNINRTNNLIDSAFSGGSGTGRTGGSGGGTPSSSNGGGGQISPSNGNIATPGGAVRTSGGISSVTGTAGRIAGTALRGAGAIGSVVQLGDAVVTAGNGIRDGFERNSSDPVVRANARVRQLSERSWLDVIPGVRQANDRRLNDYLSGLRLRDPATYAAIYPDSVGAVQIVAPVSAPYTGGQTPRVLYRVTHDYVWRNDYGEHNATNSGSFYGPIEAVFMASDDIGTPAAPGTPQAILLLIRSGGHAWLGVPAVGAPTRLDRMLYYGSGYLKFSNLQVTRADGQPDTGGNPPPIVPGTSAEQSGISGLGTSVLGATGYIGDFAPVSSSRASLDGTAAPPPRGLQEPPLTVTGINEGNGDIVNVPPPANTGGFIFVEGGTRAAAATESTSGTSAGTGIWSGGSLASNPGGEIYFDSSGSIISKEQSAANQAGIGFSSDRTLTFTTDAKGNTTLSAGVTASPNTSPTATTTPAATPSPAVGDPVPKPEAPGAKPTPTPTPAPATTPAPDPKFDLTKTMLDEIALTVAAIPALVAIKDLVTKAWQNTETIKGEPKAPCLAPVYVPPVGADVKKSLAATNALQGVTIAQGQAMQNAIGVVSTKLGGQLVGGISGSIGRLYGVLGVDRWLNLLNTALLLHNAMMLSTNVLQTVGSIFDNILQVTGFKFKNADGNDVSPTELFGLGFNQLLNTVLGAENAAALKTTLKKANAIYQAAANMLWSVQSLLDSARSLTEIAIENTGKIGNALRKAGAVFEDAYRPMVEKVTASSASQQKFENIIQNIDDAERVVSTLEQITSEGVSIKDNLTELKTSKKEFTDSIEAYKTDEKTKDDATKVTSTPPDILKIHLVKSEDP